MLKDMNFKGLKCSSSSSMCAKLQVPRNVDSTCMSKLTYVACLWGNWIPTFQRNMLPSSSRFAETWTLKIKALCF